MLHVPDALAYDDDNDDGSKGALSDFASHDIGTTD